MTALMLLLLASGPCVYWTQGIDSRPTLEAAGVRRLCVPPDQAGAWKADLQVAEAEVAAAEAQVAQTETEIARLTVRAPTKGVVLQVNVRAGEFAPLSPPTRFVARSSASRGAASSPG